MRRPGAVHIGDARGRIALWLDEQSAYDLADCLDHGDLGRKEILDAVEIAYPSDREAVEDNELKLGLVRGEA